MLGKFRSRTPTMPQKKLRKISYYSVSSNSFKQPNVQYSGAADFFNEKKNSSFISLIYCEVVIRGKIMVSRNRLCAGIGVERGVGQFLPKITARCHLIGLKPWYRYQRLRKRFHVKLHRKKGSRERGGEEENKRKI